MTIGEKIQYYRKKVGMSQEELGNRLLLSRQTISLWEMDKTVPTVDNLIRLKEIFGVSIDEILNSDDVSTAQDPEAPKESYSFSFDKKEARSAISPSVKRGFYIPIPFMIFGALFSFINFIAGEGSSDVAIYLFVSLFVYPPTVIALLIVSQRVIKKLAQNMSTKEYHYTLFNEAMNVEIYRNNTLVKTYFIAYDAIENIKASNNFISFTFDFQRFVIKRDVLIKNSIIESLVKNKPIKEKRFKKSRLLSIISWILFAVAIASIFLGLITSTILGTANHGFNSNMWVFFPAALIPFCTVIFGVIIRAKKYKGLKNIIVGTVMTFFCCVYGMFYFVFPESHDETLLIKVEEITEIDLPEYINIISEDARTGTSYETFGHSTVYLEESVAKDFEAIMENDTRFQERVPTAFLGLIPAYFSSTSTSYEYSLFYRLEDGSINELPTESGRVRYIAILYDDAHYSFLIIEYEIEYTK